MAAHDERLARARVSLEGLSVGDGFGERFFTYTSAELAPIRQPPPSPWPYTDDTAMALSIVSILRRHGAIDQEALAQSFAERYDFQRGYGPAMHRLLGRIRAGEPWRACAYSLFDGQGSYGNGSAMRIAPLGAYFADDLDVLVAQARLAAEVTHTHPEALAGAVAVAAAAAWAWRSRTETPPPTRQQFLDRVLSLIPESEVGSGIRRARDLPPTTSLPTAVYRLGNGSRITCQDTVPFALWCAGEQLDNYQEALWLTVSGGGDVDTTCAMVGGIVAAYTGMDGIPAAWIEARELLPAWPFEESYRRP